MTSGVCDFVGGCKSPEFHCGLCQEDNMDDKIKMLEAEVEWLSDEIKEHQEAYKQLMEENEEMARIIEGIF